MALSFLFDEHLRGPLWSAIQRHNLDDDLPLDVVRVGDPDNLPLGSNDPTILLWAEREQRILVTQDRHSMAAHVADHVAGGHHCPGVLLLRSNVSHSVLLEFMILVAYAGVADEFRDVVTFIP